MLFLLRRPLPHSLSLSFGAVDGRAKTLHCTIFCLSSGQFSDTVIDRENMARPIKQDKQRKDGDHLRRQRRDVQEGADAAGGGGTN